MRYALYVACVLAVLLTLPLAAIGSPLAILSAIAAGAAFFGLKRDRYLRPATVVLCLGLVFVALGLLSIVTGPDGTDSGDLAYVFGGVFVTLGALLAAVAGFVVKRAARSSASARSRARRGRGRERAR